MNKKLLLYLFFLFLAVNSFSQIEPVDVSDLTFKVGGVSTEEFYYGFAEGDKVIFSFTEVNGKELKEIELVEYPSSSKFMEYETKKIENKIFNVQRKGIYKFRFYNSALGGRVCKIKVQRIPAKEESKSFNTNIVWKTLYDTTYYNEKEKYLVKSDTIVEKVCDQIARVHSSSAINGQPNKTIVDFILPQNTVSWTYYIGVGEDGKKAYDEANQKFLSSASKHISKMQPYGPLVALAIDGISFFTAASGGDNIHYWFITDAQNAQNFMAGLSFLQYKQGNVLNDYGKLTTPLLGRYYIGLYNDNVREGIDVNIKIVALRIIDVYGVREVQKMKINSNKVAFHEE